MATPKARSRVTFTLAAIVSSCGISACDRTDLSDGVNVEASRSSRGDLGDEPSGLPGCPQPPAALELPVKINEVMLENVTTIEDETGSFPPWLELYNTSDEEIQIGRVPLSDDFLDPEPKWEVPCIDDAVIPPKGYLVIWLDGREEELGGLHADILLAPGSRSTLLLNKGTDFFAVDGTQLEPDKSVGRTPDGETTIAVLVAPTPGAPNAEPASPPLPGGEEDEFIRGDSDGSLRVNIADVAFTLRVLFRAEDPPDCQDRMDANDDGQVDLADATYTGDALFRDGPRIPPPFPETGADPTEDALTCPADQPGR